MASPAQPVEQTEVRLLVTSAELTRVAPPPGEGASGKAAAGDQRGTLLVVRGRPLDRERSSWPDELRFHAGELRARLPAGEAGRIRPSDVISLVNVDHSVFAHQPTHYLEDILSRLDRENRPLMAVARQNPQVRILDLKRLEEILVDHRAPYMDRGYATLSEWEITLELEPLAPASPLAGTAYRASFCPTSGRVNAEWTLDVDLEVGTVRNQVIWTEEPEPDPGE